VSQTDVKSPDRWRDVDPCDRARHGRPAIEELVGRRMMVRVGPPGL